MRTLLQNAVILCVGGHDPSGCAGLSADARMIESLGGRAATLNTCLTSQSRTHFDAKHVVDVEILHQQWASLRRDTAIDGIKIGALATHAQAQWLADIIKELQVPVVIDPVLSSSAGRALGNAETIKALLPLVGLATPNTHEAVQLGLDQAPRPCDCLITRSDENSDPTIRHQLWLSQDHHELSVRRREGQFRGSGCLLASAICAYLVAGHPMIDACREGLKLVDLWLAHAWTFEDGIHLPRAPGT